MMWWALLACQQPVEPPPHRGGIALGLFSQDASYDYGLLIQEIAETGATDILLAVPWSVPTHVDHAVRAATPRDALSSALRQASHHGLTATVMPILTVEDRSDGVWRGDLAPHNRDRFWGNYRALLRAVAIDAERGGAHRLVMGSELNALEADPTWVELADETRSHFSGRLTYSANWDRYTQVPFWHAVDELSVTAYFPVPQDTSWSQELAALHEFAALNERPLVVSEYGYPALTTAAQRPWDETTGAEYAPALQAQLIRQALSALHCQPPQAHFLWNWFGTGAADEASFTPRNRPAAVAVSAALTRPSCPEIPQ